MVYYIVSTPQYVCVVHHYCSGFRDRVRVRVRLLGLGFCVRVRVIVSITGSVSYLNENFVVFSRCGAISQVPVYYIRGLQIIYIISTGSTNSGEYLLYATPGYEKLAKMYMSFHEEITARCNIHARLTSLC